jgi:hypothetical protein
MEGGPRPVWLFFLLHLFAYDASVSSTILRFSSGSCADYGCEELNETMCGVECRGGGETHDPTACMEDGSFDDDCCAIRGSGSCAEGHTFVGSNELCFIGPWKPYKYKCTAPSEMFAGSWYEQPIIPATLEQPTPATTPDRCYINHDLESGSRCFFNTRSSTKGASSSNEKLCACAKDAGAYLEANVCPIGWRKHDDKCYQITGSCSSHAGCSEVCSTAANGTASLACVASARAQERGEAPVGGAAAASERSEGAPS